MKIPKLIKVPLAADTGYVNANPARLIVNTPNPIVKNRKL